MGVHPYSSALMRSVWGKADTVLMVFAGASAEFALNKAVDWLYFTGKLPADPIGRLFSTVTYARHIIFSSTEEANVAIDRMRSIHSAVESARGSSIPDWAYRDVLFMLIFYSIKSFELLERKLTREEKEEVVRIFLNVGNRMMLKGLPHDLQSWEAMYAGHLRENLRHSAYTVDLFKQYRLHLGEVRYFILIEAQKVLCSPHVRRLLSFKPPFLFRVLVPAYKAARIVGGDRFVKKILLPEKYKQPISELDRPLY